MSICVHGISESPYRAMKPNEYIGQYPQWFYHTWFLRWNFDEKSAYELMFINEARWGPTMAIKKWFSIAFLIWGVISVAETITRGTVDNWNIMALTFYWALSIIYTGIVFGVSVHKKWTLILYYVTLTLLSIEKPLVILIKTLECRFGNYADGFINPAFCADDNRPRLRTFYVFVIMGPMVSLLILENSIILQAIGMLAVYVPYRIVDVLNNSIGDVFVYINDGILVLGTYGIILAVSMFWHKLVRGMYKLSKNLEYQMKLRQQFVSYIFHELRNPLNIITLAISGRKYEDECVSLVKTITPSISMMENILNDTLDFQTMTQGSFKLHVDSFNFQTVIKESVASMRPLWEAKDQTCELEFEPEVEHFMFNVFGDKGRIRQIILNYLSNAVKYTDNEGSIKIRIKIQRLVRNTVTFHITVSDNGIGISDEDQQRLFQPFIQISNRLSNESKGTGLGLSIVAELVNLIGGTYGVTSKVDVGSVFYCTLPLRIDNNTTWDRVSIVAEQRPNVVDDDIENLSGLSVLSPILIVDDDKVTCKLLHQMLLGWHIDSDYVHNGQDALDMVKGFPTTSPEGVALHKDYRVILMDDMMPVMSGQTAIRTLRNEGFAVPIISITGNGSEADKLLRYGANIVLPKPIKRDDLLKALQQLLVHQNTRDASPVNSRVSSES